MSDYTTECKICGKEYENYHMTFYIENNDTTTCVCRDCFYDKIKNIKDNKFYFHNHIPNFVDGASKVLKIFDTKEELIDFINTSFKKDNNIICREYNMHDQTLDIITVQTDEKHWWVHGTTNLPKEIFPDWKLKVIELFGEIKDPNNDIQINL